MKLHGVSSRNTVAFTLCLGHSALRRLEHDMDWILLALDSPLAGDLNMVILQTNGLTLTKQEIK